jgi:hypothetical protein
VQTSAFFPDSGARQLSDYAAGACFRWPGRLTGLRFARNIVRIRMIIRPAPLPPENGLFHVD